MTVKDLVKVCEDQRIIFGYLAGPEMFRVEFEAKNYAHVFMAFGDAEVKRVCAEGSRIEIMISKEDYMRCCYGDSYSEEDIAVKGTDFEEYDENEES